ncbi:MAG TPA: saccharopine dehydrogenase NADP-binding domain-containing protein, partial [Acidobacteriota bacterium]
MNILLLGVGMQGKAALHDLWLDPQVERIVAADGDLPALQRHVRERRYGDRVVCAHVDAGDPESVLRLLAARPAVAVDLLPSRFSPAVGRAALRSGVHLVNTVYVLPEMRMLEPEVAAAGLTFLPEFGM